MFILNLFLILFCQLKSNANLNLKWNIDFLKTMKLSRKENKMLSSMHEYEKFSFFNKKIFKYFPEINDSYFIATIVFWCCLVLDACIINFFKRSFELKQTPPVLFFSVVFIGGFFSNRNFIRNFVKFYNEFEINEKGEFILGIHGLKEGDIEYGEDDIDEDEKY